MGSMEPTPRLFSPIRIHLATSRRLSPREEEANLRKRQELLVFRSEAAQCRRSARDRQARLGERIATLRAHLVEEMDVIARLGESRHVGVGEPLSLEVVSESETAELCENMERDWMRILGTGDS
jgi:hypothetical protein